jgi:bifunctional DNA-binding transcriptional regulator/antitoxin component of YhaV-PrlF toxin-antitoxin module
VLPAELRAQLAIKPDTPVEFFLAADGQVRFHAIAENAWAWRDVSPQRVPPLSTRDMDDAVGEALVEDDERIRSYGVAKRKDRAAE